MRKLVLSVLINLSAVLMGQAQSLSSETFGSGSSSFTMDFVSIGNPNNPGTAAYNPISGSVGYTYRMGKYEVSRDMVTKANLLGALGLTMSDMGSYGGNDGDQPAAGITWYEAAKFVNYLNTSKGYPPAYKFVSGIFTVWSQTDEGYQSNNKYRNSRARYYLPSYDEYFKAAFGSPEGTWYSYSTGSDIAPTQVARGTSPNTAVYGNFGYQGTLIGYGPAQINSAGGLSRWGTMAQGGNINELLETSDDGSDNNPAKTRLAFGGGWYDQVYVTSTRGSGSVVPSTEAPWNGFRVASVSSTFVLTTVVDSSFGTVSKTPAKDYYLQDDNVSLTATPKSGYLFGNWSGASTATTSSITLTMNTDKTVSANFIQDGGDSDGDGLSNFQESITYGTNPNLKDTNSDSIEDGQAVALGYSPTFNFSALISHLQSHPPTGLYTASQMQAMAIGDLVLTKNANGSFTLNYDIEQSTDLQTWTTYAPLSLPLTGLPTDKAFVRIKMINSSPNPPFSPPTDPSATPTGSNL